MRTSLGERSIFVVQGGRAIKRRRDEDAMSLKVVQMLIGQSGEIGTGNERDVLPDISVAFIRVLDNLLEQREVEQRLAALEFASYRLGGHPQHQVNGTSRCFRSHVVLQAILALSRHLTIGA